MVGATIDTGHIRGSTDIGVPPERRGSAEARDRFNDVLGTLFTFLGDRVFHAHLSDVESTDSRDSRRIASSSGPAELSGGCAARRIDSPLPLVHLPFRL